MDPVLGYRICPERNVIAAFVHFMPRTGDAAAVFCAEVLAQRLAYFCTKALICCMRGWASAAAWLNAADWLPAPDAGLAPA